MEVEEILRDDAKLKRMAEAYNTEFVTSEALRRNKEIEWVEDLRQVKGIYDPLVLTRIQARKGSEVYPKYTRSKEVPCIAKLNNMLFPSNDRNWDIEPTPQPLLTDEQMKEVAASVAVRAQNEDVTDEVVEQEILRFAKEKCDNMRIVMDDQLTELNIEEIDKKIIRSGVRLGTGIKKGPLVQTMTETYVAKNTDGTFEQKKRTVRKPYAEYTRLWNWYPDMSVTDYESCRFSYELHCLSRNELRDLAERNDFWGDKIKKFLADNKDGNYQLKNWETDLQGLTSEQRNKILVSKYQVLERWGWIDGYDLRATGIEVEEEDVDSEFYSVVWIVGNEIIKVAKVENDPRYNPIYNLFYLEKDESSIFGSSLPRAIRDTAISICSAVRAMLDNAAAVAGPITETNVELLEDGEDADEWYPRRNFKRTGTGAVASWPAIRAINIDSHMSEYIAIIELFKRFGDEESAFPAIVFSEPVAAGNETVGGMSIRASNMNVTIGDVVKSFDAMNEGFLRGLYKWNMEFNEDASIKGDASVKAKGYSSLLSKEMRTQALDFFATTLGPLDEPYIKRRWFLEQRMKTHDLDADAGLNTEAEARAIIDAQHDREAEILAKQNLAADIRYTQAKAEKTEAGARATDHKSKLDTIGAVAAADKADAETDAKKAESVIKVSDAIKGKGGNGGAKK